MTGPPSDPQSNVSRSALHEDTVESELVYQGVFLKVMKDRARVPDGSVHPREWVMHPGASAIVAWADDGRVLVERQFRYPMGREYIEIPAGKIDAGEAPLHTAQRELLEETGYCAQSWAPLTKIHPAIGFSNEVIHLFLARELELHANGPKLDAGEHIEIEWVSLGSLVDALRSGRLPDVKTQIGVMHLQRIVEGDWDWPEVLVTR